MNFKKQPDEKCRNERKRRPTHRESCKLWLVAHDQTDQKRDLRLLSTREFSEYQNEIDKNESHGPKQ